MSMAATLSIRAATADDVARIVDLLNLAFAMERAFIDRDRTSIAEIARLQDTGTFFVIDGDEGTLAACMYVEKRADRMYLGMLAVHPSQQKRGLGRRMMADAESHALALGCRAIDIRIVDRRTELPPFYRLLGFADRGTEPFDDALLKKPCHFILMSKELTLA
jgi:N-acetylglutamate synthase-like GNAT family acetyltransferase